MKLLLGLSLLFWATQSQSAQILADIRGPTDEAIYSQTLNYCHHIERAELEMGKVGFVDFNEKFGRASGFSISPQLDFMLSSLGYFKALKECFGENEGRWNFFTLDMIFSERVGKAAAALVPLGVVRLLRLGVLATPLVRQGGPAVVARVDTAFQVLGLTVTLAPSFYLYARAKIHKYKSRAQEKRVDDGAIALRFKIDEAYARDQRALAEAQKQFSSTPSKDLEQKIQGLKEDMDILDSARSDL